MLPTGSCEKGKIAAAHPEENPLPPRAPHPLLALALLLASPAAFAQQQHTTPPPEAATAATEASEVPEVPGLSSLLRGFNGGITISGVHDAVTGWATLAQPALSFSFNDRFALDITVPIYMYRLTATHAANPRPNALLVNQRAEPGDVIFGLHTQFTPRAFNYEATVSATAPTGDEAYGLTTGRATFDLSNLFERSFRFVTPSLELGVGDSTTLTNRLVTKDYTSLGPLAHFELGVAFPLPFGASFQANAYEQLPIGDQKIYQSVKRGKTTTLVVSGHSVTEDNGFTNSLDLPLDRHTTLSTYYSRSLRLHDDIVSVGITYVLRGANKLTPEVSDDELMRNIQRQIDGPIPAAQPPASPRPPTP